MREKDPLVRPSRACWLLAIPLLATACDRGPTPPGNAAAGAARAALPAPGAPPGPAEGIIPGSRAPGTAELQFVDVAEAVGLHFTHHDGRSGRKYVLEIVGSGAAFFDHDGDGDADVYLVDGTDLPGATGAPDASDQLFENRGGTFTNITASSGIAGEKGYGHGCAAADLDGDGKLDLYVANRGDNFLWQNQGAGSFVDVARTTGVTEPRWSTACACADHDLDGDVDIFVANYLEYSLESPPWCGLKEKGIAAYCEPNDFPGQPDALYRNDGGKFVEVAKAAGVDDPNGKGLGAVWGDYDNDGDPDLFVANDSTENRLFKNLGNGKLEEIGFRAGVAVSENGVVQNGMGTTFGDWDNDGWLDLTVTNYADQSNSLHRNDRNGYFTDITTSSRTGAVTFPFLGWATELFDPDNDGFLDLFVANGHLHDNLSELGQSGTYAQRNLLFFNQRDGTFSERSLALGPGLALVEVSRGAAFADLDLDGDVDILVTNSHGPVRLLRNDGGNRNRWLGVRVLDPRGHETCIGARLTLQAGGSTQIREVRSGGGYLSQNELRVTFGLGQAARVDRLEVRWPSGRSVSLEGLEPNRTLEVREPPAR